MRFVLRRLVRHRIYVLAWIIACGLASGFAGFLDALRVGVLRTDLAMGVRDNVWLVRTRSATGTVLAGASPAFAARAVEASAAFDAIGVYWPLPDTLVQVENRFEVFRKTNVTREFFEALGMRPLLGTFADGYVISHAAWQGRFAGRADIIGVRVTPEAAGPQFSAPVVAVLPPRVTFPEKTHLWLIQPAHTLLREGPSRRLGLVVSMSNRHRAPDRQAELQRLLSEAGAPDSNRRVVLQPLSEYVAGPARPALKAISIATGLFVIVALVATANISLARTTRLLPEYRVMSALGCPVHRVALGALGELAAVGALALTVGALSTVVLSALTASSFPDVPVALAHHGLRSVAAVTLLVWFVSGVVTVVTLLRWLQSNAGARLDRTTHGSSQAWTGTRRAMVMTQIVLAAALAMVAGAAGTVYLHSIGLSRHLDSERVVIVRTRQPVVMHEEPGNTYPYGRFLRTVESAEASLRGMGSAVAYIAPMPVADVTFEVLFHTLPVADPPSEQRVAMYAVSASFFDVMRIPLIAGRGFRVSDRLSSAELDVARGLSPGVAVLSTSAAATLGGASGALGRTIQVIGPLRSRVEVVGVVADFQGRGLDRPPEAAIYLPYAEFPLQNPAFAIRTEAPAQVASSAAEVLRASKLPLAPGEVTYLRNIFSRALSVRSLSTILVAYTAFCSIVLACASVFGLLAFLAHERRRDIGIFLALGLSARDVRRRLTYGLSRRMLLSGAAGIAIGIAAVRVLHDLLTATPTSGLWVGVSCAIGVIVVAILSAHVTAASTIDPHAVTTLLREP